MRISVVVPVLEEAAALSVLIESLADRTDIDELIVVDASRSREVLEIYAEPGGAPQRPAAAGGRPRSARPSLRGRCR
ncbi:MAG: glycosyltransferase [Gammaproteobacteria bacterium]|nr:glycosyltransferase [Gammaproteobacteria bacterium]